MASKLKSFVQPAQELFSFRGRPFSHTQYRALDDDNKTGGNNTSSTVSSPFTPHSVNTPGLPPYHSPTLPSPDYKHASSSTNASSQVNRLTLRRFNKLQRRSDQIFGAADLVSTILTVVLQGTMLYVLIKFYQTRNIPAPEKNRTSPWATGTTVWPTYMLFSVALSMFVFSLVSLIRLCRKRDTNRIDMTITVVKTVIQIGVWVTAIVVYRIEKKTTDLWGWSCSEKAQAIQDVYVQFLDFEQLCRIQSGSWLLSIFEALIKITFIGIGFYYKFKVTAVKREIGKESGKAGWETLQGTTSGI